MGKKKSRKQKNMKTQGNIKDKSAEVLEKETVETKYEQSKEKEKEAINKEGKQDKASEEELNEKLQELNDKYLRLYSEFDNYRKRTIKERIELSKTASEEVITELLPVLDDFERAVKSSADDQNCKAIKEGVDLILNKFKGILEKKGLKPIAAIGEEFDTDYHEAITYIPAPSDDMKGKIVDEIEKGYMLNDKVIRYTKVVIGQ
jgi:molecular chaperone GrpE